MRVVLDTSVLFAAFRLESGFCTDLFRQCVLRYDLVTSEHILDELQRHLIGKAKVAPLMFVEILRMFRYSGRRSLGRLRFWLRATTISWFSTRFAVLQSSIRGNSIPAICSPHPESNRLRSTSQG